MCTNFALIKSDGTAVLADRLGIDDRELRYSPDIRPGNVISIVVEEDGKRVVKDAIWWLYLRQTEQGLKPHPDYFSVNTNYAKLPQKAEYRQSRCIIMASAFVESQNGKNPHLLRPADGSALAFGGLWKTWSDKCPTKSQQNDGQVSYKPVYSASIIALPGLPELADIHKKAFPLWLPKGVCDMWLDRSLTNTNCFADLLNPKLRVPLEAVPVDRATSKLQIGAPVVIS